MSQLTAELIVSKVNTTSSPSHLQTATPPQQAFKVLLVAAMACMHLPMPCSCLPAVHLPQVHRSDEQPRQHGCAIPDRQEPAAMAACTRASCEHVMRCTHRHDGALVAGQDDGGHSSSHDEPNALQHRGKGGVDFHPSSPEPNCFLPAAMLLLAPPCVQYEMLLRLPSCCSSTARVMYT